MKTLVIDNHDSFTYNLVHQLARINQEPPVVVLNDEVTWDELEGRAFDNIVISPGPGRPDRVRDFGVSRDAILHATVPILGVCLGHQGVLSTLSETSVKRAPTPVHGRVSSVFHTGTDLFEGLPSPFAAARYHSLIVPSDLPAAFERTAWTSDSIVMGIAHTTRAIWGVQFHPESIITEYGDRMMSNFRDLSRARCPTVRVATTRTDGRPDESAPARRSGVPNKTTWRSMAGAVPAEAAFVNLFGEAASAFWLDSSLASPGLSRWSYMGDAAGPHSERVEYSVRDGIVRVGNHSGQRAFTMTAGGVYWGVSGHRVKSFNFLIHKLF